MDYNALNVFKNTHTFFMPHQLQKKSGWTVYQLFTQCVSFVSLPVRFFFPTPPLTCLSTFSISLTNLFPFHPVTVPSHLQRFLSFPARCGDERFEQHPKALPRFDLILNSPHLPPSSFALLLLFCFFWVMQTHSITQQGATFPSIKNKIKSSDYSIIIILCSPAGKIQSYPQFCVKFSGSLAWGRWQFSTCFLMFLFLVKPQWHTSYTCP